MQRHVGKYSSVRDGRQPFEGLSFPEPVGVPGPRRTAAELLPAGYQPWALLTDVLVASRFGPLLSNRFSDLVEETDPDSAIDLDSLRLQVVLSPGERRFPAEVARALLRATTSRSRLYLRAGPDGPTWTMSPKDLLFAEAFQRHLPIASSGEIEIVEAERRWYLRLLDGDPFVFLAAGPELDRALESLASPSTVRIAPASTFGIPPRGGAELESRTLEAGIS